MRAGGPWRLPAGAYTDDTAMALAPGRQLGHGGRLFRAQPRPSGTVRWYLRRRMWSSTGRCFDIGNTTRAALEYFEATGRPDGYAVADANSHGNGSIMRLAPVALAYAADPERAMELAAESSRVTHAAGPCVDACRYLAALLVGAVQGRTRDELTVPFFEPACAVGIWKRWQLLPAIAAVAGGSFRVKEPPEIAGTEGTSCAAWRLPCGPSAEPGVTPRPCFSRRIWGTTPTRRRPWPASSLGRCTATRRSRWGGVASWPG